MKRAWAGKGSCCLRCVNYLVIVKIGSYVCGNHACFYFESCKKCSTFNCKGFQPESQTS